MYSYAALDILSVFLVRNNNHNLQMITTTYSNKVVSIKKVWHSSVMATLNLLCFNIGTFNRILSIFGKSITWILFLDRATLLKPQTQTLHAHVYYILKIMLKF